MEDRILKMITKDSLDKIKNTRILLIGLGGVGGYAFEALVRSCFCDITVIDGDIIEESNLNRQILATTESIGNQKVLEAVERAKIINPSCQVEPIFLFLQESDITEKFLASYDYIIDACDTVSIKVMLIRMCTKLSKKLISCTGTANKVSPQLLEVVSLGNTTGDPLARVLRNILKKERKCLKTMVVSSKEVPLKQKELGTLCPVPMAAGSLLVSYILNDIL